MFTSEAQTADAEIAPVSEKPRARHTRKQTAKRPPSLSKAARIHRERRRAERRATYARRLDAGICTYSSSRDCPQALKDGSSMCEDHTAAQLAYVRKSQEGLRSERRAKGLCIECGLIKTGHWRCAGCAIRLGYADPPVDWIGKNIVKKPEATDRFRSETIANPNIKDKSATDIAGTKTTQRYIGQGKRGSPSKATLDQQDARAIVTEAERAAHALAYAHSDEVAAMPSIQRQSIKDAAMARYALIVRFIADLHERNDYE